MPDDEPRPAYRLFPLDAGGRVRGFPDVIEAASDEQAIQAARASARDRPVELWMGVRRVAVLNGTDADRSPGRRGPAAASRDPL